MRNVYLSGMPGCGKSTLGEAVAKKIGWEYVDLDKMVIEKEDVQDMNDLFAKKGVAHFRKLESQCIEEISQKERCLVSLGGGAILNDENVKTMMNSGKVVFVDVSLDTLRNRIDVSSRPLVKDINQALEDMYYNRIDRYRRNSNFIFDNEGPLEENVNELAAFIVGE